MIKFYLFFFFFTFIKINIYLPYLPLSFFHSNNAKRKRKEKYKHILNVKITVLFFICEHYFDFLFGKVPNVEIYNSWKKKIRNLCFIKIMKKRKRMQGKKKKVRVEKDKILRFFVPQEDSNAYAIRVKSNQWWDLPYQKK